MKKAITFVIIVLVVEVLFCTSSFGELKVEKPVFEDTYIKVTFSITQVTGYSDVFGIKILNKTDKPIKILWDESVITDNWGRAVRALHSGIKFIHADQAQVPTVIPPYSEITDIMVPQTHIEYSNSWKITSLSKQLLDRYFILAYEVSGHVYYLQDTLHLSYVPPSQAQEFPDAGSLLIGLGVLIAGGILVTLWILSMMEL